MSRLTQLLIELIERKIKLYDDKAYLRYYNQGFVDGVVDERKRNNDRIDSLSAEEAGKDGTG